MNKTTIIGFLTAVLVLGAAVVIAQPGPATITASPLVSSGGSLRAEETSFDFGAISMAAGTVTHSFKIDNTGATPVVVGKMYTSCMCTTATLVAGGKRFGPYGMPGHGFISGIGEPIAPGEEATVEVVFDPAAHGPAGVGRIQRTITIENSAGQALEFGFTALVTP